VFLSSVAFGQNDTIKENQKSKSIENLNYLTKEIEDNPKYWNLYYMRAFERKNLGDLSGALKDCKMVVNNSTIENDVCECYNIMGQILSSQKEYNKAILNFNRVIEIDSNNADYYYSRGYLKFQILDDFGAIEDFNKALEIEPNYDNFYLYHLRGNIKHSLKEYSSAITDFNKVIELKPNYEAAYWCKGLSKYKLKDYSGAILDFTKTIKLNPNYTSAYKIRGIAKEKLGQSFCSDYKKACELGDQKSCEWYNKQCN